VRLHPTPQQLAWQRLGLGVFFHVGINTFFDAEWSDGTLPATGFAPTELDADQWVRTAAELGAGYVVLTAKHHDGFCLWPSATTSDSVASSPWRGGRGDLVAEVAQACGRHGVGFGVYLSPWDRNAGCYADPAAYDAFYCEQLTELCTAYGPLTEIWFDGAGSTGRTYDWDRIMSVVREHQPDAMVFNMGSPTIRWVGNEDGLAADPVRYVVDRTDATAYDEAWVGLGGDAYLPPECDVSLRRGWFWSASDGAKSVDHLLAIYYRSVGMGANLLLNVPPDRRGLLDDADVARLREWRAELDRRFGSPVAALVEPLGDGRWRAAFDSDVRFDHVVLTEDYNAGQRVTGHRVLVDDRVVAAGMTIGERRIHAIGSRVASQLVVELVGDGAVLAGVEVYDTGGATVPEVPYLAATTEPDVVGAG